MELVFADCYNATVFAMSKIIVYEENCSQKEWGLCNLALIERRAFLLNALLTSRDCCRCKWDKEIVIPPHWYSLFYKCKSDYCNSSPEVT